LKKSAIFITVRTDSSRLPKKALREIGGKTTIEWVIERVARSKKKDLVVLCTTDRTIDDGLCNIANKSGILFHRGNTEDKLERWRGACDEYSVDYFVTADGDDLFCEPELIDSAISQFLLDESVDFIKADGVAPGAFTYGIKAEALRRVCELKDTSDTEMMWVYFTDTGLFNVQQLHNVNPLYYRDDVRMTLDYEEDFDFFKTIIEHFARNSNNEFSLMDVLSLIDDRPDIKDINFFRNVDWKDNQVKHTRLRVKGLK
jgi:spore coat polysaccharide biosynthesis protein SpsF